MFLSRTKRWSSRKLKNDLCLIAFPDVFDEGTATVDFSSRHSVNGFVDIRDDGFTRILVTGIPDIQW